MPTSTGAREPARAGQRLRLLLFERRPTWRTTVLAVIVLALIPVGWSYAHALNAPGNTPAGIRSVEWLKDHHLKWMVNDIENFWYTHHKPKTGGAPSGALAATIQSGADQPRTSLTTIPYTPSQPGSAAGGTQPGIIGQVRRPPSPIPPVVATPIPGEGEWIRLGQSVHGVAALYAAYVRPDPIYTSLVTAVVWMDPALVRTALYAGVQEPGGRGWRYQAPIAFADRPQLLAAFNSGFKFADSQGGYYADGQTVRALRAGAATLVVSSDGTPVVGQWGRDLFMGPDVAFARQNLSLIVDGGQPVPGLSTDSNAKWGGTLGNKVLVWRSGAGTTADGALIYVAGNNLSVSMLANTLARAGAVRAMELDINSAWVDFFTYTPAGPGATPSGVKLLPDMTSGPSRYFDANSRDFFAVFSRG
jgi:hypothetical protein